MFLEFEGLLLTGEKGRIVPNFTCLSAFAQVEGERKAGKRTARKAAGADDRRGHHSCDGEEVSDALVLVTY